MRPSGAPVHSRGLFLRGAILLSLALLLGGCRSRGVGPGDAQPLRVAPAQLDLGSVALTFSASGTVTVTNPNLFPVALTWSLSGPFMLEAPPAQVGGGATLSQTVLFVAAVEGPASGVVTVNGSAVALTANAFDPHCQSSACSKSTYDPTKASCVTALAPDGTDCSGSNACLGSATCHAGECLGTPVSCDDGNPCTVDVCGTMGCGHLNGLLNCPQPDDPCQIPACDADAGCGAAPAPDGTSCGSSDCRTAQVCIDGACVVRSVPPNQSCVDVVVGVPAGVGTANGQGANARFESPGPAAYDFAGNRYMVDLCVIRKVTPSGVVTTLAGTAGQYGFVDGFGSAARLFEPGGMVFDGVDLIVFDGPHCSGRSA